MEVKDRDVDVVEQLGVILDRVAAREKDNDLLFDVFAEEREKEHESLVRVADDIALLEHVDGRGLFRRVDIDVERPRAEGYACQVCDFGRLRSGKEHRLAVF